MSEDDFDAMVGAAGIRPRAELARFAELVSKLSWSVADDASLLVRERLFSLDAGSTGEHRADIFLGLCESARAAFPDDEPTDAQILMNPATPDLLRYLLRVFREFVEPADGKKAKPIRQRAADALRLANPRGKPSRLDDPEHARRVLDAAHRVRCAICPPGEHPTAAMVKRIDEAAYEAHRKDETNGGQDSRDKRVALKAIRRLLVRDGVYRHEDVHTG